MCADTKDWFVKFSSKFNRRFRRIQTKRTMARKFEVRRESKIELNRSIMIGGGIPNRSTMEDT